MSFIMKKYSNDELHASLLFNVDYYRRLYHKSSIQQTSIFSFSNFLFISFLFYQLFCVKTLTKCDANKTCKLLILTKQSQHDAML